jgi:uncharacterized membrane protein YhaH (DUF805 family)
MTLVPKDLFGQDGFWALLFAVAVVLLNWPVLSIAADGSPLWGIPRILVYLIVVWLLIIFFAYLKEWGA